MTNFDEFTSEFRARGLHIEAAWVETCVESMPRGASGEEFMAMRTMFFCGAAKAYDLIVSVAVVRDGGKATSEDLKFLNQLRRELGEFAEKALLEETQGNA